MQIPTISNISQFFRTGVLEAARQGIGGFPVIRLSCVIEATRNPPQVSGSDQPVEGLIDRSARSQVGKVLRRPDVRLRRGADAVPDGGWMLDTGVDIGWLHVRKMQQTSYFDSRLTAQD